MSQENRRRVVVDVGITTTSSSTLLMPVEIAVGIVVDAAVSRKATINFPLKQLLFLHVLFGFIEESALLMWIPRTLAAFARTNRCIGSEPNLACLFQRFLLFG